MARPTVSQFAPPHVVQISCAIAPVQSLRVPLIAEKQTSHEWAWLYK